MSSWRQAGINYIRYSQICARVVRHCLKPELRVEAVKRDESIMKAVKWENGKPTGTPITSGSAPS